VFFVCVAVIMVKLLRYIRDSVLLAGIVPAQAVWGARATCEPNGLCFVHNPIGGSLNDVGFAFPTEGAPEMLLSMKVQLSSYGFAGIMPVGIGSRRAALQSDGSLQVLFSIAATHENVFSMLNDSSFVETLRASNFIGQTSKMTSNELFVPAGVENPTISQDLFFMNTSYYHLLARLQGPAVANLIKDVDGPVELMFVNSTSTPQYPPGSTLTANFSTSHMGQTKFTFDAKKAQFSNYTEMLEIAGLN